MQPYYNQQPQQYQAPMQDQYCMPPPQPAQQYYQQPMNYQPQNYEPNYYQVAPAPLMYPVQQMQYPQSEVNVKVEVKSKVPSRAAVTPITSTIISERKIWTHSHYPTIVFCTQCQQTVNTIVIYTLGAGSWLIAFILCLCFWPLTCLPCCMTSMQDAVHHCSQCGRVCGRKNFLF